MKSLETREVQLELRKVQRVWEERFFKYAEGEYDSSDMGRFIAEEGDDIIDALQSARATIALLIDANKTVAKQSDN